MGLFAERSLYKGEFNEKRTVLLTRLRYNHYHLQSKDKYICRPITVSGTGAEPFI